MSPIIEVDGLSRQYRLQDTVVDALRQVSFNVDEGEFVAIMGPSGSGKSTLMHLLGLLDRPTGGSYFLAGEDVNDLTSDQQAAVRNRQIGFIFQSFNLLARNTALENVELSQIYAGLGRAVRQEKARRALDAVGLGHRTSHWPHQLSGGEQQRVAIARALLAEPLLVLADEPTGALDSRTGLEILALFQRLNGEGQTIVLVTHDRLVARHATRTISMRDGRIVADRPVNNPLQAAQSLARLDGAAARRPEVTA